MMFLGVPGQPFDWTATAVDCRLTSLLMIAVLCPAGLGLFLSVRLDILQVLYSRVPCPADGAGSRAVSGETGEDGCSGRRRREEQEKKTRWM